MDREESREHIYYSPLSGQTFGYVNITGSQISPVVCKENVATLFVFVIDLIFLRYWFIVMIEV